MTERPLVASRVALVMACMAVLCTGCREPVAAAAAPPRSGRLGSLRDLVLFDVPNAPPELGLFVDRFETTRGDWHEFAATGVAVAAGVLTPSLGGETALPIAGTDLRQARAFAAWRCLRLPRRSDWELAVGASQSRFPWGDRLDASRANTGELGLFAATPVGTFESGRRAGDEQPYDLIGNVSEWTETVAVRWLVDDADAVGALQRGLLARPAFAAWAQTGGLLPPAWVAAAGGAAVPRDVVGGDFLGPMAALVEAVPAGDQRQRTGFRLCATALELVQALAARREAPSALELAQLRWLAGVPGHARALAAALSRVADVDRPFLRALAEAVSATRSGR